MTALIDDESSSLQTARLPSSELSAEHRAEGAAAAAEVEDPSAMKTSLASDEAWSALIRSLGDGRDFDARYRGPEAIARGGMGEVIAMWDERIGREVAVKLIRRENATNEEHRARFLHEANLQARLEHPSIVPVHDIGVAPTGQLFFTMKRVRGLTLKEIMSGLRAQNPAMVARFTRRRLLTAFNSVCLTIAFAHDRGVIHRDLKPSNIMLGDFGETYVLDWGLAKRVGETPSEGQMLPEAFVETRAGFVFGTPGFMAPEQFRSGPASLGPNVDVYALGAILFELLTLQPLFAPGLSRGAVVRATLDGVETRTSVRCPEAKIPDALEAIVAKATAYHAHDRYLSVRALSDAIERFLDGDRDHNMLAEMAAAYADSAASALAPGSEPEAARIGAAMQDVGRALALDARNASALETLRRLLFDPLREPPKEALAAVAEAEERSERRSALGGARMYFAFLLLYPILVWVGVRDYVGLALSALTLAALAGLSYLAARSERRRPNLVYVRLLLGVGSAGFALRQVVPMAFMPAVMLAYAVCFTFKPSVRVRWAGITASVLGVAVPTTLEYLGLIPPTSAFVDGMLCFTSQAGFLQPERARWVMTLLGCGLIIGVGVFVVRMRDELSAAERRMHTQNWLLSQLMPAEARPGVPARSSAAWRGASSLHP